MVAPVTRSRAADAAFMLARCRTLALAAMATVSAPAVDPPLRATGTLKNAAVHDSCLTPEERSLLAYAKPALLAAMSRALSRLA